MESLELMQAPLPRPVASGGDGAARPSARSRFVSVHGVHLHYIDEGSGLPVVFLHGAGGLVEDFTLSPLFPRLTRRYRVLAFDRPGFGRSMRPDSGLAGPRAQARLIHAALLRLDIRRPVLIGHSWSGALALAYALAFPQDVAAVVHLAGWALPARHATFLLFSLPRTPLLGEMFWPPMARALAPELIRRVFAPQPVPAAFEAGFPLECALRPSQLMADAADVGLLNPCVARLQPLYGGLRRPVEIVAGTADLLVEPTRHALPLLEALPDARLTLLDGIGHMPHHVAAEAVAEAVDRAAARSA